MKEIVGNIWDFHEQSHWIVIPTNGSVKANGEAVMGAGLAKQAAEKFPDLPKRLGILVQGRAPGVHGFLDSHLYCFPTKLRWQDNSIISLIDRCAEVLAQYIGDQPIYLPRLGCGERTGKLKWKHVKPVLERYLDDRFVVVTLPSEVDNE